jgi:hypothetical protein
MHVQFCIKLVHLKNSVLQERTKLNAKLASEIGRVNAPYRVNYHMRCRRAYLQYLMSHLHESLMSHSAIALKKRKNLVLKDDLA